MQSALLALMLLATTTGPGVQSEFEEKLAHCEEAVEPNDNFIVWQRNFEDCMSDFKPPG